MTDTKHTPGPWRSHYAGPDVGGFDVLGPEDLTIARGADRWDARLIAAAPELLEALKALIAKHAYAGDDADGLPGESTKTWLLVKRARAAIAKAEGR